MVIIWGVIKVNGGEVFEVLEDLLLMVENFFFIYLWFLYLFSIFYVVVIVIWFVVGLIDLAGKLCVVGVKLVEFVGCMLVLLFLLVILVMLVFMNIEMWYGWFGILMLDMGFYFNVVVLIVYGIGFVFGWILYGQSGLLDMFCKFWWVYMVVVIVLMVVCLQMIGLVLSLVLADDSV